MLLQSIDTHKHINKQCLNNMCYVLDSHVFSQQIENQADTHVLFYNIIQVIFLQILGVRTISEKNSHRFAMSQNGFSL